MSLATYHKLKPKKLVEMQGIVEEHKDEIVQAWLEAAHEHEKPIPEPRYRPIMESALKPAIGKRILSEVEYV